MFVFSIENKVRYLFDMRINPIDQRSIYKCPLKKVPKSSTNYTCEKCAKEANPDNSKNKSRYLPWPINPILLSDLYSCTTDNGFIVHFGQDRRLIQSVLIHQAPQGVRLGLGREGEALAAAYLDPEVFLTGP